MGNFSRDTFDSLKRYVGVRLQMGVPLVDADWNEQEDIRKWELRTFLKWFVGDGILEGSDGFAVTPSGSNDFVITGGTESNPSRCLADGLDAVHYETGGVPLRYTTQILYDNAALSAQWGVSPVPPLTPPASSSRIDLVYLDIWDREIDSIEDPDLVDERIGVESCVRMKREWVVRVLVSGTVASLPAPPAGHAHYPLALISHRSDGFIQVADDLRTRNLSIRALTSRLESVEGAIEIINNNILGLEGDITSVNAQIEEANNKFTQLNNEVLDARGTKANLGNRLDESLMAGGGLRFNTVGNDQIQDNAVTMGKLAGNSVGSSEIVSGAVGNSELATDAVTKTKIANDAVGLNELDMFQTSMNTTTINAGDSKRMYLYGLGNAVLDYYITPRLNVLNAIDPVTDQPVAGVNVYVEYHLVRRRYVSSSSGVEYDYVYLQMTNTSSTHDADVEYNCMWIRS